MPGLPPNFTLPRTFTAGQTARAADVMGDLQGLRDVLNLPARGVGTLGARPNANTVKAGYVYLATDDWGGTTYVSDGATWTKIASRDRRVLNLAGVGGVHNFDGLDGNAEIAYELLWAFHVAAPGGPLWLRFNDDAAAGHYTPDQLTDGANHALLLSATGIGESRQTGRALIQAHVAAGTQRLIEYESVTYTDAGASSSSGPVAARWTNTVDKITKISVSNQFNLIAGLLVLRRLV